MTTNQFQVNDAILRNYPFPHQFDPYKYQLTNYLPNFILDYFPKMSQFSDKRIILEPIYHKVNVHFSWRYKNPLKQPHTYMYRLQRAIIQNDLNQIKLCLKRDMQLNAPIYPGSQHTPLTLAIAYSRGAILQLLLLKGANPNFYINHLPLTFCAIHHRLQMASLLLNGGADIYTKQKSGLNVLQVTQMFCSPQVVNMLKNHKISQPKFQIKFNFQKQFKENQINCKVQTRQQPIFNMMNDIKGNYRLKLWNYI